MSIKDLFKIIYDRYISYGYYQKEVLNVDSLSARFGILSKEHFIMSSIMIGFIIIFTYLTRNKTKEQLYSYQRKVSLAMFILELIRMAWFSTYRPDIYLIRFDYCNQVCLYMPIMIILGLSFLYPAVMTISFWGGAGVMLYPLWVFRDYGGFHLMSIQSMISHGLMLLTSINLARINKTNLKKDISVSFIVFTIMATISYIMSIVRNQNYLAMLSPDGLPFISKLKYPYHILFVVGIIYLGLYLYIVLKNRIDKYILTKDQRENTEVNYNEVQESNITI